MYTYNQQKTIEDAVETCCEKLDSIFPGREKGGISTKFAGKLEEAIKALLKEEKISCLAEVQKIVELEGECH
jgi:hypothetical protein